MRFEIRTPFATAVILLATFCGSLQPPATAWSAPVTYSGNVSYQGTYAGDTLYVAVLDTTGSEDVTILDIRSYAVDTPPFNQPFDLTFDNAGANATVFVVALLDTDGDGLTVTGVDVFGWYSGTQIPTAVSTASSQSGLDFALPRAEIRGTVTFAAGQTDYRMRVTDDAACIQEGFRPGEDETTPGDYAIVGIYPGTYCVFAEGQTDTGSLKACFGDVDCRTPTLITLGATEVRTGVDFDFSAIVPVEGVTWGRIKSLHR